ncbi:MAG TPA: hypothetical protein PKX21_01265 [Candidatus Pacearchaeota archaeon]|nr:hypothetical protein [Candidatus Pacearchaeota archaeon]
MKQTTVIKSSGEEEAFSWEHVYSSARKVGATREVAVEIADQVAAKSGQKISTADIRRQVEKLLRQTDAKLAMRFSLPEAMRRLGPTGFPFENYIGRIFESQGFTVKVGTHLKGRCVSHEVDFLAWNDQLLYLGECKYHNKRGAKVDLPTALLYAARFDDLENGSFAQRKIQEGRRVKSMMVTNTEFTQEAIKYFDCIGKSLWGWKYPPRRGIERMIDEEGIYPVTVLPSFRPGRLVEIFSEHGLMLAKDVLQADAKKLGLPPKLLGQMQQEARELFGLE